MRRLGRCAIVLACFAVGAAAPAFAQGDAARQAEAAAAKFGGPYADEALQRYVASVGTLVAATAGPAAASIRFQVLDSDIVNAFALPGGYVFVTRGLLAVANNEAELAGVLGHETGHITGGHHAQRDTRAGLAQLGALGAGLLGALLGDADLAQSVGRVATASAALYVQKYSRDQEFEADDLGVVYIARAGFDPRAMASFLRSLQIQSEVEALIAGRQPGDDGFSMLSDHPRTLDRVRRAAELAGRPDARGGLDRELYLSKIDGLLYGDDPQKGVVRARSFLHPGLGFAFDVPEGYQLANGERQVVMKGPAGASAIFDQAPNAEGVSPEAYIARVWAPGSALQDLQRTSINGLAAATATTRAQTADGVAVDARLVAIAMGRALYRFVLLAPAGAPPRAVSALVAAVQSFRPLGASEADAIKAQRVRIVTVRPGDTVARLAERLPFRDHRRERFLALNGLADDAELPPPGTPIKIVE